MNKARRKEIKGLETAALKTLFEAVREAMNAFNDKVDELVAETEHIRDGEQEYIDLMPENLQRGEKAETAEQSVSDLDEAITMLEDAKFDIDDLEPDIDEIDGKLDEAAGVE